MIDQNFTVVIVSYGSAGHLAELLPLLGGLDIVVVDNGPSDLTLERSPEGVRVIGSGRNIGFGAAVNLAVQGVTAPFVVVVNPDARPTVDDLARLVANVKFDSGLAQCGARLMRADGLPQGGSGGWQPTVLRSLVEASGLGRFLATAGLFEKTKQGRRVEVDWVAGACVAVRTDAFRSVGGFDSRWFLYFEDWDLGSRLERAGWRSVIAGDIEVPHFRGTSSGVASHHQQYVAAEAQNEYLRCWMGPLRGRAAQTALLIGFVARYLLHRLRGHVLAASETATHLRATLNGRWGILPYRDRSRPLDLSP